MTGKRRGCSSLKPCRPTDRSKASGVNPIHRPRQAQGDGDRKDHRYEELLRRYPDNRRARMFELMRDGQRDGRVERARMEAWIGIAYPEDRLQKRTIDHFKGCWSVDRPGGGQCRIHLSIKMRLLATLLSTRSSGRS